MLVSGRIWGTGTKTWGKSIGGIYDRQEKW